VGGARILSRAAYAKELSWDGKTVTFYVGIPPGGSYDMFPRILAEFMAKRIPGNPRIIVENMPGAGSLTMMNYLYNLAPRDGTAIGFPMNTVLLEPTLKLMSGSGGSVKFDLSKVSWLGTPGSDPAVLWVSSSSPIKTFAELRGKPLNLGATAPSADSFLVESLCNKLLGTQIKIISGYAGLADYAIAFERGEIDGAATDFAGLSIARPDWLETGKIRVLAQFGMNRSAALPDVPTAVELAENDDARAMLGLFSIKYTAAYPVVLPPGIGLDAYQVLKAAFIETSKDPGYQEQLSKLRLASGLVSSDEVTSMVAQAAAASSKVIDGLRAALTA
jgi:tripartite-type tricarboxylate transporter receptor subunit TctC